MSHTRTELTVGDRKVAVEIDLDGNVVISGAQRVVIHYVGHMEAGGKWVEGCSEDQIPKHLSFRCEAHFDAPVPGIWVRAFDGPTSSYSKEVSELPCMDLEIQSDEEGVHLVTAVSGSKLEHQVEILENKPLRP